MVLSPHVLRKVAARAGQDTRVACCVASRRLYDALAHVDVWRQATVFDPSPSALNFLRRVRTQAIELVGDDPRRVEWFLESLVSEGMHVTVDELTVDVSLAGWPRNRAILGCVSEFTELRRLVVRCHGAEKPACLAFPGDAVGLRQLRQLHVSDAGPKRKLEVYLGGASLPSLEDVYVVAATCDVLAHAARCPRLRRVTYLGDKETFEDVEVSGMKLASLMVRVPSALALHYLCCGLSRARFVDQLTLVCQQDTCIETFIDVGHLRICLCRGARAVDIVHAVVRGMDAVTVDSVEAACSTSPTPWTLRFTGVGSWHNFQRWLERTTLTLGLEGSLVVQPT